MKINIQKIIRRIVNHAGLFRNHGRRARLPGILGTLPLLGFVSFSLALLGTTTAQAQYSVLHSFTNSDGTRPNGELTLSGSTLYGMASFGASGGGTMFSMNTDGTGFSVLHTFTDGATDGYQPTPGAPTLSGSTLYGTTYQGGSNSVGTVFSMNTDGTGFSLLHSFTGNAGDGSSPYSSLTLSGSTLFGTASRGGSSDNGTVFKMNTDGTGYTNLYSFVGGGAGANPIASLTLSGSTLYGTVANGGANGSGGGTVYSMNTDGTGYTNLHTFTGADDNAGPMGPLTLSGSTLYGTTYTGGSNGLGTVFTMNTDGTGYTNLHTFTGDTGDGSHPFYGSVKLSGSTLSGMTYQGGSNGVGVVFEMNTDGSGYTNLHSFADGAAGTNGYQPRASVILSGSTLYGTTEFGGANNLGTVFALTVSPVPEPSACALVGVGILGLLVRRLRRCRS